jgi:uncharacterized protein (TIGR03790 family)
VILATWFFAGVLTLTAPVTGPLTANDLLLVYNGTDADSRALAEHYAEARGVPRDRLCPLALVRSSEEIGAAEFEKLIREPVRKYLEDHQLRDQVRCLVTFYGLPIRVGRRSVSAAQQQLLARWRPQLHSVTRELEQLTGDLESLGGLATRPAGPKPTAENEISDLLVRYLRAREAAIKTVTALPAAQSTEPTRRKWLETMQKAEGLAFLATYLQAAAGRGDAAVGQQLEQMRQAVGQDDARLNKLLAEGAESPSREEARQIIRKDHGLLNLLTFVQSDVQSLQVEETEAAVDSELMLLWWTDYPRFRWVINTLNWQQRAEAERRFSHLEQPWNQPVLMVSRIDAGNVAVARRMIDRAITVEQTGLTGSVYIDARGISPKATYGDYDEDLRKLARLLQNCKGLSVTLDNKPGVFQSGECPRTMLYCGWYSLRKYVPAFTFVPGAVAFHIGSFEAISLKGANETGWCKRLLDNGAVATLGPVAEPYLASFPPPGRFFGLLLTGRYTLVECYAYTLPYNSWMQMLLGDPLYRPFARKSLLTVEQVFDPREIPQAFQPSAASQPATSSRSSP